MESNTTEKVKTVKTIGNALDVLDKLRISKEPLGVNALSRECDLNPATTFRILKSLEEKGWACQLADDRYVAGRKLGFVTCNNNFYMALRDAAKIVMDAYTEKYEMAMNLFVRDGAYCELIAQSLTKSLINHVPPLNAVLPCNACASGKVLVSELPEAKIDIIVTAYKRDGLTPYTITDADKFRKAIEESRANGYATDYQELSLGGSCVSVPVRGEQGNIIAALSFSGLLDISNAERLLDFVPVLHEASKEITRALYG